jgi:erythrin-vacuolar iron transport family protein
MSDSLPNLTEFTKIAGDDKSFLLRVIQPGRAGLMDLASGDL